MCEVLTNVNAEFGVNAHVSHVLKEEADTISLAHNIMNMELDV